MKVYEVMTQDPQTVSPSTLVFEAAKIMDESKIGFLPVILGPHVIGVITDRDLATRVVARGLSTTRTRISKVMTPDPIFVYDDQPVEEAVGLMCRKSVSRLLVQNRRGLFVGLLSFADIATLAEPEQSEIIAEALGESYWQNHMFATASPRHSHLECLN